MPGRKSVKSWTVGGQTGDAHPTRFPCGEIGGERTFRPPAGPSGTSVRRVNELVRFALVAYFPREGDWPGLADMDVDEKIAALRRDSTWLFWVGLVGAALFFQLTPILTVRRPWPAALLDEEQLDTHAHKLASYPVYLIRQILVLLKLVGGMFWGQSDAVRTRMALPPYPQDPGTRRTEAIVTPPLLVERTPGEALVQIGRKEDARGRGRTDDIHHSIDVEAK